MALLLRVTVAPHNAQIELSDTDAHEYPQWQTGRESVVATPRSVAVATQDERDGKVLIEVWQGALVALHRCFEDPVYDGVLVSGSGVIVVGSTVGGDLHPVQIAPGHHRLRVFSVPVGRPAAVYFLLGGD